MRCARTRTAPRGPTATHEVCGCLTIACLQRSHPCRECASLAARGRRSTRSDRVSSTRARHHRRITHPECWHHRACNPFAWSRPPDPHAPRDETACSAPFSSPPITLDIGSVIPSASRDWSRGFDLLARMHERGDTPADDRPCNRAGGGSLRSREGRTRTNERGRTNERANTARCRARRRTAHRAQNT